jgi:hypothetical protein
LVTLGERMVAELLIGREVEISVGEPWDFEYPGGGSILRGRVPAVEVGGEKEEQRVSVELETPFVSEEGPVVRSLVARRRHVLPDGIVGMLAAGERVSANLSYSHAVPEGKRLPGVSPFLIGVVRLAAPGNAPT